MKSLVTGGCGFIGSHVVDRLVDFGHEVIVVDNLSAECNEEFFKNNSDLVKYYEEDICDYSRIEQLFEGVDYVFHLAAESRIGPTLEDPQKACMVNFLGTCNVLQAARKHGVRRTVYSSTSACYGLKNVPPLVETMQNDNLNPYSVSKLAAEDLCIMYNNLFETPTNCLRYFNVFGERMPETGQYAPVVAIFERQVRNGNPITVVGDGLQERDFIYVKDIVEANILAAISHVSGEVFNVGSGSNVSVLQIAKLFQKEIVHLPSRKGEARSTLADISKIQTQLDWNPTVHVLDWIKQRL